MPGYGKSKKNIPVGNYNFSIEIDGINEASFARVSGMGAEIQVEDVDEGGMNYSTHKIPVKVKYNNITLEKGITKSKELLNWFSQACEGVIKKRDFSIILSNNGGDTMRRWNFTQGYPVRWESDALDAQGNNILLERIELCYEGMSENS